MKAIKKMYKKTKKKNLSKNLALQVIAPSVGGCDWLISGMIWTDLFLFMSSVGRIDSTKETIQLNKIQTRERLNRTLS